MTLEQFVKPVDGRTTFTIYVGGREFLHEGTYDYAVLSDDEWEDAKAWRRGEPTCMSQMEWWPEVKDLKVNFWHVGGGGYQGPQIIIFLKP